jgi:hypothetical protein
MRSHVNKCSWFSSSRHPRAAHVVLCQGPCLATVRVLCWSCKCGVRSRGVAYSVLSLQASSQSWYLLEHDGVRDVGIGGGSAREERGGEEEHCRHHNITIIRGSTTDPTNY